MCIFQGNKSYGSCHIGNVKYMTDTSLCEGLGETVMQGKMWKKSWLDYFRDCLSGEITSRAVVVNVCWYNSQCEYFCSGIKISALVAVKYIKYIDTDVIIVI